MPASFHSIAPLVPSGGRLAEAVAFYAERMGFAVAWQTDTMAGLERDGVELNQVENSERTWLENASFSIGVSDLDALYEEYRDMPARVGALEIKEWGRREFHLIAPSGVCFQFYHRESAG